MTEVEGRLHRLEVQMQGQEQKFHAYEQRLEQIVNSRAPANHSPALLPSDHSINVHSGGTADLRSAGVQELFPEEASTDGMAITYADEEDSGYFGPSHLSSTSWLLLLISCRSNIKYILHATYFACNDPRWQPRGTHQPYEEL